MQCEVLAHVGSTRELRLRVLLVLGVLHIMLGTGGTVNASDLQRRLNVVDGCVYHFQILGVVPLGFAAFDVAIVSLGALYLLI